MSSETKRAYSAGLKFCAHRAQSGRCYLCGETVRLSHCNLDHVLPRSKGFRTVNNTLVAHYHCNSLKGNRLPYPCELLHLEYVNPRLPHKAWQPEFNLAGALRTLQELRDAR